ncbi:MAG: DUF5615 family PIN-like protein [bacterium]|nr:DUF5615 family PIN-like protein [bacterium]
MAKNTKYKWRFYADNNIERELVEHLRESDFDVLWIAENPRLSRQQEDRFHYQQSRKMKRYLLTRDLDFWDDRRFPLQQSPGALIITTNETEITPYLPRLLRKIFTDYNPLSEPLYMDKLKIKADATGFELKGIDHDSQKVTIDRWTWKEIFE